MDASPRPEVDVVIPVYGGLRHVRSCLTSVVRHSREPYHLIIVDDESDGSTAEALDRFEREWSSDARLTVLRNPENLGFLRTANRGMSAGDAPYVVLLNSDTLVTPGWLEGLVACLTSRPDVGIASPLSNYAQMTGIRTYYGADHEQVAAAVGQATRREYPEIHLASGFCLAVRRQVLEELGFFDEVYGRGYFEESDLCLRASRAGWRTVADDATYVHHHGWGSFEDAERRALMTANEALFDRRWGDATKPRIQADLAARAPFVALERRVAAVLQRTAQVKPRRRLPPRASRRIADSTKLYAAVMPKGERIPTSGRLSVEGWRQLAERSRRGSDRPPVKDALVLVDDLVVSSFTSAVIELVDLLNEQGVPTNLATSGDFVPGVFEDPCRVRPFVVSGPDEMLASVPAHGVVIATSPSSVYDALLLRERDGNVVATWFDPQPPTLLGSTDEAWSPLTAPMLADGDIGPVARADTGGAGTPWFAAPLGVALDVYTFGRAAGRECTALVTHDASAGQLTTQAATRLVDELLGAGVAVTLYGDRLPGVEADALGYLTTVDEAALLRRCGIVVEAGPIPGLERFRLRCAAAGAPIVLAEPVSATCPLDPRDHAFVVPGGDIGAVATIVDHVLSGRVDPSPFVDAARARAQQLPIEHEADALGKAIKQLRTDRG